MKKLMCLLLTLSLGLGFLTASYAQDAVFDPLKASDVNTDGKINILDLTFLASHFGEVPTADQTPNPDVNGDGTVNILDLTLVASHFGKRSGIPLEVTDATFDNVVQGSALPIVVKFKADWCPFCRQMAPIVTEVASEYRETFAVAILDVDESRQTTGIYQIRGIPTYIVFQDGKVVGRFGGAMPRSNLVQRILGILGVEKD